MIQRRTTTYVICDRQLLVEKLTCHPNFPTWRSVAPLHEQRIQEMPMAKKEKMLEDLFHETLKDIYYAEKKILTALPKMEKAARSEELQAAFEKHEGETKDQSSGSSRFSSSSNSPQKAKPATPSTG
jgi:hypothetical protein